jgi:ABC-type uncharacterized transport system permease subunit
LFSSTARATYCSRKLAKREERFERYLFTSSKEADLSFKRALLRPIWLGAVFTAVLAGCIAGLAIAGCKTALTQKQSFQQAHTDALVQQISTLKQSDLIVFPDGRVLYVRSIQGSSMDVVGWIGDNVRSEDINSFVLTNDDFKIVRQNDPNWEENRDNYFKQ